VRDVTRRTIDRIVRERDEEGAFGSLDDWLVRVQPRRHEAENLVRVGALDGLGAGRRSMLHQLGWAIRHVGVGQLPLPFLESEPVPVEELGRKEILKAEEELLGMVVSEHPMQRFLPALQPYLPVSSDELIHHVDGDVVVAGMRVAGWRHHTKSGEEMLFLTLEDMEGMIEVVVFPEAYARRRKSLSRPGPFVVWGRVQAGEYQGDNSPVVVARDVRLISPRLLTEAGALSHEGKTDPED